MCKHVQMCKLRMQVTRTSPQSSDGHGGSPGMLCTTWKFTWDLRRARVLERMPRAARMRKYLTDVQLPDRRQRKQFSSAPTC